MQTISEYLYRARLFLLADMKQPAIVALMDALFVARQLPTDVPRNRCLRAYIAQAIGALQ